METLAKKILLWVAAAFLSFILVSAVRYGAAELLSLNARLSMQGWEIGQQSPSVAQVESVAHQFEIARFLADDDPGHHENIARLSLVRAALPDVSLAEKSSQLQLGIAEIRTAIALLPASPYGWTILLLIKRDMGEFDAEFLHALHRSVELGAWEPELLPSLADVGLSAWKEMPAAEQALIQQVFVRGMERQSALMSEVAHEHRYECIARAKSVQQKSECQ